MKQILPLNNTIQNYAWGSHQYIAELMGRETPSPEPEAEVWMGAHPKAPSKVDGQTLGDLIEADPDGILGPHVVSKFDGKLPFLFKLLAAGQPLSIQSHPNLQQAKEGYERENREGIPLDAPHRNYKDDNHKPEIICAISEFWGLNGFREIPELIALLGEAGLSRLDGQITALEARPDTDGLRKFFKAIMELPDQVKGEVVDELVANARERKDSRVEYDWVLRISELYPGDIGVLCVLLLNLVQLQPGEAMYCAAGDLHAYLDGFGVELMANSDNVLRGGLTPKHVDVPELMKTLTFDDRPAEILQPEGGVFPTPADEFVLSIVEAADGYTSPKKRGIEIAVSVRGDATITNLDNDQSQPIKAGHSVVIPAAVSAYQLSGDATVYIAGVKQ